MVVATNQSGIGRGLFDMATLNAINDKMHTALGQAGGRIDALFYCPHPPTRTATAASPSPACSTRSRERFNVDLEGVPSIGDSLRDLQAAAAAGAQPMLVLTGKGSEDASKRAVCRGHPGLRGPGRAVRALIA